MASKKVTGKDLRGLGYPEGKAIGIAMDVLEKHYKGKGRKQKLELMGSVITTPAFYLKHEMLGPVAKALIIKTEHNESIALENKKKDYVTYGAEGIEQGAVHQMEVAMKLPVTHSGALMPDAHQGYGLPIGGVLATNNAVIPYAVGVDIGCRMCLSVYDIPKGRLSSHTEELKKLLNEHTRFGQQAFQRPMDDEVLSREEFREINVLKSLKDRAYEQIGTSGGGNHFVEFGHVEVGDDNHWQLPRGSYLAVLSHSGSRGLGANIARHYTKLAADKCRLPGEAKHLAWLDIDTDDGREYWAAMTLAGDYASANHRHIHERLTGALGENPLFSVENHHNFAWKETAPDGKEVIVHRKGATPADKGVLGIIPGSMTSPGFVVMGKGHAEALNSASHGAGRVLSRKKAKETLSKREFNKHVKQAGVTLIGSGLDEAPMVYKDIRKVMSYQTDLVDVLAEFHPRIVRMAGGK